MSETSKFRHLTLPYLQGNPVLDLGAGGDPVVPWAIQVDLPEDAAKEYNTTNWRVQAIQIRGSAWRLPWFTDGSCAAVYSSHLLEDASAEQWPTILTEWCRVVRPGGYLVILVPDHVRFRAAVAAGQPDNPNHLHECTGPGELTELIRAIDGWEVVQDRIADDKDYSILFVARRVK